MPPREPSTCEMVGHRSWENLCFSRFASSNFCRPLEELSDTELWTEQLETMRIHMGWLFCVWVCLCVWCSWDVVELFLATQAIYIYTYRLHTLCTSLYKCIYIHLDSQSYMNNILCVSTAWRVEQIFGSLLNSDWNDIFWSIDTYFTCKQRQYF